MAAANRRVSILSWLVAIAGIVLVAAGIVTWIVVQDELAAQKITVSDDARWLAGDEVDGPFSAYAQADVIDKHALEAAGGKTYAELPQDDPNRETVMTASFLRASLYTSVVSFGVAAMAVGLGIVFILIAMALRATGRVGPTASAAPRAGPEATSSD